MFIHDTVKEAKEQEALESSKGLDALLLTPPSIDREVHFLVCTIYRAEQLPSMDDAVLGITKVGVRCTVTATLHHNCVTHCAFPCVLW